MQGTYIQQLLCDREVHLHGLYKKLDCCIVSVLSVLSTADEKARKLRVSVSCVVRFPASSLTRPGMVFLNKLTFLKVCIWSGYTCSHTYIIHLFTNASSEKHLEALAISLATIKLAFTAASFLVVFLWTYPAATVVCLLIVRWLVFLGG